MYINQHVRLSISYEVPVYYTVYLILLYWFSTCHVCTWIVKEHKYFKLLKVDEF